MTRLLEAINEPHELVELGFLPRVTRLAPE